jgi:predicted O-methyltransferase YrrM
MNNLSISRQNFSKLFWEIILTGSDEIEPSFKTRITDSFYQQSSLRDHADNRTGSISLTTAHLLGQLAKLFAPTTIAEVGTYIGRSTAALAIGAEGTTHAKIHTCDATNSLDLSLKTTTQIVQYKGRTSTDMFRILAGKDEKVDLIFLDGRINSNDLEIIKTIVHKRTIFIFDDFEGIEKGVVNTSLILSEKLFKNYLLVYPPVEYILKNHNLMGKTTLSLLIPPAAILFTNQ